MKGWQTPGESSAEEHERYHSTGDAFCTQLELSMDKSTEKSFKTTRVITHTSVQISILIQQTLQIKLQTLNFSPDHSTEHTNPCGEGTMLRAKVDCAGAENVALLRFHLHAPIQQTLTVPLKCGARSNNWQSI